MSKNQFSGKFVEYHVIQDFPVTCLNRDDNGSPKKAVVNGEIVARVSSQCWKRQVRMMMHEQFQMPLGIRTKLIKDLIIAECLKQGATQPEASACGLKIEKIFIKVEEDEKKNKKEDDSSAKEDEKTDTLLYLSPHEVSTLVEAFKNNSFDPNKVIKTKVSKTQAKEVAEIIGKPNYSIDGLDIALFGRMVAQATSMNVEAATQFSHAISTHKVSSDIDFFTALDDRNDSQGSAHMGYVEFNSATYYRYISLDLGQLYSSCGENVDFLRKAVDVFTKSLFLAIPAARQTTISGMCPWEFARVIARKGQGTQAKVWVSKAAEDGFVQSSKEELCKYLDKKDKIAGSLSGKLGSWDIGDDENFSIDNLTDNLVGLI